MSLQFVRNLVLAAGAFFLAPAIVRGQTNYYTTNGAEYAVVGSLPGDQMFSDVAITTNGGFVVWQDNATDGSGWGISARRVDATLSGTLSTFRVNVQGTNDQERPRVSMLKNGGAVFVWQGGKPGYQHIYARFLSPTNTWLTTTDLFVSGFTNNFQINPAVATLNNSNVVVVWSSFNQVTANSLLDIYAKILSPTGTTISNVFRVNQFTNYNQRTPAIAALKNGGFVVTWVSEQQRSVLSSINSTNGTLSSSISTPSVDIYARLYGSNGSPANSEFLVSTNLSLSANPAVAAATDGSYLVAWSSRDTVVVTNYWDVCGRSFSNSVGGAVLTINTYQRGNQYVPQLSALGQDYLAVWTSLGQDGSREGVFGQFIHSGGVKVGGEFQVNTTTFGGQLQPSVASDGINQFIVSWSGYADSVYSFDLFSQRYANVDSVLQPMPAPFVYVPFSLSNNVYQPEIQVSWAPLLGMSISSYQVYVDGSLMAGTTSNLWTMTAANGLVTNSTHSFQLRYVKTSGAISPLSGITSATTWSGLNYYGIPFEWMVAYYGNDVSSWPSVNAPLTSGGPTLLNVFLSGGNPLDSSTWLVTQLISTKEGTFLYWNTQPGLTYQVQTTTNFVTWSDVGTPRFAAGSNDSIYVGGNTSGYYRVLLVR